MTKEFQKENGVYKINIEIECQACGGTGLYVGCAELDGAAVVCHSCNGTGSRIHSAEYREFTGRQARQGVERVYKTASQYVISAKDHGEIKFSEYGCTYYGWLNGVEPRPIEALHCPCQHTHQERTEFFYERCDQNLQLGGLISNCPIRGEMSECWKRYYEIEKEKG
jgi:hypothetical protein